jgi:ribosomal protein S1
MMGKIVRLTEFGAFVELFEGVEGLVHVSELANERIEKPEDKFAIGQDVRIKIIKMDPVEKKIGLSIRAALNEPDSAAVEAYFSNQGDGSATLGDLMDPSMFRQPDDGKTAAPEPTESKIEEHKEEPKDEVTEESATLTESSDEAEDEKPAEPTETAEDDGEPQK